MVDTRYITHSAWTGLACTQTTYPNGREVTSGYDALYRRNSVTETSGGTNIAKWQFFGKRTATTCLGNGITCSYMNDARTNSAVQSDVPNPPWGINISDRLGYDGSGRLITKRYVPSCGGTTPVVGFTTQFDPSSNKLFERALHAESRSALYPQCDSMDRLLEYQRGTLASGGGSVASPITLPGTDSQRSYNLDGLGNWKNTVYMPEGTTAPTTEIRQHNKLNEITQFATTSVLYDHGNNTGTAYPNRGNGNIADDGTRVYGYDALNRLTTVTRKSDNALVAAYTYDALGRRVQKVTQNGGIPGTMVNAAYRYLYDGQQIVEEGLFPGESYSTLRQFVWGQYIDELIQINVPTTSSTPPLTAGTYYPLQDLLYRTAATTSSTGSIFEAYDYDAYGNTLIYNGAGAGGNWWANDARTTFQPICENLFTGRQYDPEMEIYFYRTRYYSGSLARFASRDPITFQGGANLYLYVNAAPTTGLDPHGLKICAFARPASAPTTQPTSGPTANTVTQSHCCCPTSLMVCYQGGKLAGDFGIKDYFPHVDPYWGADDELGFFNVGGLTGHKFQVTGTSNSMDGSGCTIAQMVRWTVTEGGAMGPWVDDAHRPGETDYNPNATAGNQTPQGEGMGRLIAPGKWSYTDPPAVPVPPDGNLYRKAEFDITYDASPGCPCKVTKYEIHCTQVLKVSAGQVVTKTFYCE